MSILSFLKKKSKKPTSLEELAAGPVVEKQIQINDIVIHTMPERFRRQSATTNTAKTAGVLIIVGGALFLILVSAGLYFYLIKKPAVTVKPEETPITTGPAEENNNQANQPAPEINLNPVEPATSTEPTVVPEGNGLATTTTSTPEIVEPDLTVGLIPALDSDNDGLTDAEEILLKTSTSTPDTDGDGYLDGAELLNLYNPAGAGKLASNTDMALYNNSTFNYSMLHPQIWQMSTNGGDDSIMFKTIDNQFFQIIVQPNTEKQPLDFWYIQQLDIPTINDADRVVGANWQGIKNLDGLTLYLTDSNQNYIYTLAYNPGENNILDYINIFNMMIKSFTLKE